MITRKCAINVASENWVAWTQPKLTANGTLGGDAFACSASEETYSRKAYGAFNLSVDVFSKEWGTSKGSCNGAYVIFYNPLPLKVSNILVTNTVNGDANRSFPSGTILGSTDGVTYVPICTFTNSIMATGATWNINVDSKVGYKYHKILCTGTNSENWLMIAEFTIMAEVMA